MNSVIDEAFVGEHHSAGWEIISSPEIFMAVAATRTKRIMLGSGVVSVPYHHPFHIANRFALLDQLTRGRVILGCGPGALPSDAYMLGIETTTQRDRMVEGIQAIMRLFNEEGGVSIDGSYFKMRDAHLQVKPFQKPHMPVFVANTFSPSGMVAAGKLGCGVLSIATFAPGGLNELPKRWAMGEEIAAENGKTIDRNNWRLVFPVHLAESKKEALDDMRDGCNLWIKKYFIQTLGAQIQFEEYPGQPIDEMNADRMASRGGVIVGTPDDAIAKIKEVWEASGGGFGGMLLLAHEWAPREKILHSYELWARYVAPHFQGVDRADPVLAAMDRETQRHALRHLGAGHHEIDAGLQRASQGKRASPRRNSSDRPGDAGSPLRTETWFATALLLSEQGRATLPFSADSRPRRPELHHRAPNRGPSMWISRPSSRRSLPQPACDDRHRLQFAAWDRLHRESLVILRDERRDLVDCGGGIEFARQCETSAQNDVRDPDERPSAARGGTHDYEVVLLTTRLSRLTRSASVVSASSSRWHRLRLLETHR